MEVSHGFFSGFRASAFCTSANNFVFFVFNFRFDSQQNEVGTGFWFGFASNFHLYVDMVLFQTSEAATGGVL